MSADDPAMFGTDLGTGARCDASTRERLARIGPEHDWSDLTVGTELQ